MSKKANFLKSLNIEGNELTPVLLLMAQSVFIGVFYGAFDIAAHTLFLRAFPEDMIGKAYMISGVVGILLTASFSKLQTKIKFSKLAQFSLLFIAILTVLLRLAFEFGNTNWIIMLVFVLFGPLNIIGMLAFWGTAGRIFNLRQGKRLFGIIDAGQIFGIILSSYIIPIILIFLKGTNNLLLICSGSIAIAMLVEIIITRKFNIDKDESDKTTEESLSDSKESEVHLKDFSKQPYLLYMALFVAFSMFAAFFVQYSFMVVIKENYPVEEDLAKFLGFFTGTMMVFILIIKTFVYGKLLKTYGLKISLMLSSILLALFTGIAIASGLIAGIEVNTPGFLYFFLFIALSKLFNKTLKDALEVPSFKLLYQSLSKKIRFDVQAKIDGTVNEIAALISGALLSILGIIAFVKLIHYSVVLFVILGVWTLITVKLYREYKKSLGKALSDSNKEEESDVTFSRELFVEMNDEQKKLTIRNMQKMLPFEYRSILIQYLKDNPELEYSYDTIIDVLTLKIDKKLRDVCLHKQGIIFDRKIEDYTLKEISYNFSRDDLQLTVDMINYINSLSKKNRFTIISALLRTPSLKTQRIAIKLCGYFEEVDTIPTIIEFISSENLMPDAISAIHCLAPKAYKQLIQVYFRSDITSKAQLVIIDVLSQVNEEEVYTFLLNNLFVEQTDIVSKSIQSLIQLKYKVTEEFLPRLFEPINRIAGCLAWDIAALASFEIKGIENSLYASIRKDYNIHIAYLFNFLKICYDRQSVETVEDFIASDDSENVGYGLELFDMFLSEEIKPALLLLFDEVRNEEKARLLESFFAVETTTIDTVIVKVINRNPNLISKRTKKLALYYYTEYYNEVLSDISSQLFSPVEEIQVMAANTMLKLNKTQYQSIIQRVDIKQRKRLDENLSRESKVDLDYLIIDNYIESFVQSSNFINLNVHQINDEFIHEVIYSDKNSKHEEQLNNYFVFLVFNPNSTYERIEDFQPYFLFNKSIKNKLSIDDGSLVIGISMAKLNELIITNKALVQNILKYT